jgi:two-component system, cell cycle sensor histidine kinase and response regulator CckA
MNLCTNAFHAMKESGGVIEVVLEPMSMWPEELADLPHSCAGPCLRLSVTDTGVGMEPDILERIFDPYFTTKKIGEGTGMGLSTVHGIVRNHGGDIHVHSEPGKGTTVNVYFPVIPDVEATPDARLDNLPTGNERILFVDDESFLVETGKEMLESLGYHVESMNSSVDALERITSGPEDFDLLLTDLTMPKVTGDVLAYEIKKIRPDIPVIIASGFSSQITPDELKHLGVSGLLMKPFSYEKLAVTVREALDGK